MPSLDHELLVEMFRQRPALAPELLRICANVIMPGEHAALGSIDLSQTMPSEYRTDALVVMRNDAGDATSAVVVEVQLAIDRDRHFTWPLYVAAARANLRCPVALLVVAPEMSVARWAGTLIQVGYGCSLEPIVIDFDHFPRVEDVEASLLLPELAVIAALAHPDTQSALVAHDAISPLDDDIKQLYWDSIVAGLPDLAIRFLEQQMEKRTYPHFDRFIRVISAEKVEIARVEGQLEVLLQMLRAKFGDIPTNAEQRLRSFDAARRARVVDGMFSATSLDQLFAD